MLTRDDALSPVVAVVILILIIGVTAFFTTMYEFGSAVNFRAPKIVTLSVRQPAPDQIVIIYTGGKDAAAFIGANVSIEKGPASTATGWTWSQGEPGGQGILDASIGSTITATAAPGTGWPDLDRVVVVGWFSDGQKQVVIDTTV